MEHTQRVPTSFLRLKHIIGDPKAKPPIPALIPVSKSAWYQGIADGIYPAPVKLSTRTSAWLAEDINALIEKLGKGRAA